MKRKLLVLIACLANVVACGKVDQPVEPVHGGISVFHDAASFGSTSGATTIDFEDLPSDALSCSAPGQQPLDNPLAIDGVVFTDPSCLATGYCSSPTCHPANILLSLNQEGTVDLPTGTRGVLLEIEGMGDVPFAIQAEDGAGAKAVTEETARPGQQLMVGFRSGDGIVKLTVVRVGPTPPDCPVAPCGPLAIARMMVN